MMICFMKPGEATNPRTILGRLNEGERCLLSGSTEKLECIPADFNVHNILPSNMVCLSDEKIREIGESLTYTYSTNLWDFEITFETGHAFERYNLQIIDRLNQKEPAVHILPDRSHFPRLFEHLVKNHVKGIAQVACDKYSMDCMQYQNYLIRLLAKAEKEMKSKSKIITPGLEIVKP